MIALNILILICIFYFLFYQKSVIEPYTEITQDPYILSIVSKLKGIHPRLDQVLLSNRLLFFDGQNRSYTKDKTKIFICSVDETGAKYPENQLIEVLIHELTHAVLLDDISTHTHTNAFKQLFFQFMDSAISKGIYNPNEYHKPNYCKY
jgi:hypothetical protein